MKHGLRVAAIATLLAAVLALIATLQPWATATLVDGRSLQVDGGRAAGGLAVLAIALAPAALVLAMARRVLRRVIGALIAVVGALIIAHAGASWASAASMLSRVVGEATGLDGAAQTAEIASSAVLAWPVLAIAGGALAVAAGVFTLVTAGRWPQPRGRATRYERQAPGLAWDVMDDGEDPTR